MIKDIIYYGVLVNIAYFTVILLVLAYGCNLKYKMPISKILDCAFLISFMDAFYKINIPKYSTLLSLLTFILLVVFMFRINVINGFVVVFVAFVVDTAFQFPVKIVFQQIFNIDMDIYTNSLFYSLIFTYVSISLELVLIFILYKTNRHIIDFKEHQIKRDINIAPFVDRYIAHIAPVFIIFMMSICTAFTALIQETKTPISHTFYFGVLISANLAYIYVYIKQSHSVKQYMDEAEENKKLWKQSEVYKKLHPEEFENEI